jgi:hypothetical protein
MEKVAPDLGEHLNRNTGARYSRDFPGWHLRAEICHVGVSAGEVDKCLTGEEIPAFFYRTLSTPHPSQKAVIEPCPERTVFLSSF